MGAAAILTLLLPYVPNLLSFLSEQLGRVLVKQSPNVPTKPDEQVVLDVVRLIVNGIDDAHKDWASEDKHRYAVGAIQEHLKRTQGLTLSDLEINVLIELYIVRKRTGRTTL